MSSLDSGGRGGEILTAVATEANAMDDDEVTNLEAIYWNVSAFNSALASCLLTTSSFEVGARSSSVASIPMSWPPSVAGAEQMVPTTIRC